MQLWSLQPVYALVAILLSAVTLPLVSTVRRKMRIARGIAAIPGPKGVPLLGALPELAANLKNIYTYQEDQLNEIGGGRMKLPVTLFTDGTVYLTSPEDMKHILSTRMDNYVKSRHFIDCAGETFSKSFFGLNHAHTADDGAMWKLQRKVAGKVFTANNFRVFSEKIFYQYALQVVDAIDMQGGKCDMKLLSDQYTLQAIFDVAIGVPLKDVDDKLGLSFTDAMGYVVTHAVTRMFLKPHYKYFWWCMPSERKMDRNEQMIRELAEKLLFQRVLEPPEVIEPRSDIMSLFIKKARELSSEEGSSILDIPTLRSIFLTFIIAGWETTSSTITHAFYQLARYPDAQRKIIDELDELGSEVLSYDAIKKLKYLDAAVNESLRINPTVPANLKIAVEDDYLPDGTFIPAGVEILYNNFYIGRNSSMWGPDPRVFRPERWLEMKTRPSAYDFPVFQAGARICPGMNMSLLETKVIIAVVLRRFHVSLQEGEKENGICHLFSATLVMEGGLQLKMTPRSANAY
ncbi:Cytochrome p450 86a2, partial [Globisporangium splendens]